MMATDPYWQARKWQTRYESRAEYIAYLYHSIRFAKKMMLLWERTGRCELRLGDELVQCITFERTWLESHQNELRRVLGK